MTEPADVLARQLDAARPKVTESLNRLCRATLAEYTKSYSVRPSGWHLPAADSERSPWPTAAPGCGSR